MSFTSFLKKHASEMLTIGNALDTVSKIVEGDKQDRQVIRDAGDIARDAANNILEAIDDVQELTEQKIDAADLFDIVKELLPIVVAKVFAEMTEKQVIQVEPVVKETAKPATKKAAPAKKAATKKAAK